MDSLAYILILTLAIATLFFAIAFRAALASRPAADPRRRFFAKVGLALRVPLPQCMSCKLY
jgi:hypothetical protein